jgi:ribonuclease D
MGLNNQRDRLCVIQLSNGDGNAHLVQFAPGQYEAPNLVRLLSNTQNTKLFHFARFDLAIVRYYLGVLMQPVYCTRTASRLARTFTDRHGLKDICRELLGKDISKQQQSSDWGAPELTPEQKEYAANDVLYLHQLREMLDKMLVRENRQELAMACFSFLPARAMLDLSGWQDVDIFAHQ